MEGEVVIYLYLLRRNKIMTLVKMAKGVIEDEDTAKQITNKICEKYHGYFVKKAKLYNNDTKATKGQINAEVSSVMGKSTDFNIDRSNGKPYKYNLKRGKKSTKNQTTLLARMKKVEIELSHMHKKLSGTIKEVEAKPAKKHNRAIEWVSGWWANWTGKKDEQYTPPNKTIIQKTDEHSNEHFLYSDHYFTNEKPVSFKCMGEKHEARSWISMYMQLLEILCYLDPEKFTDLSNDEYLSKYISDKKTNKFRRSRKMSKGIFLELNLSTRSILSILRKVIPKMGLNLSDVSFCIRKQKEGTGA